MEEKTWKDAGEAVRGPEAAPAAEPAEAPAETPLSEAAPAAQEMPEDAPEAAADAAEPADEPAEAADEAPDGPAPTDLTVRDDLSPEDEDDEEADDDAPQADEGPQDPPWCDKVFGMRRLSLYGICFGYGAGLIAAGVFDALTGIEITRASFPGLAGAVIGYFVGGYLTKRLAPQKKKKNHDPKKNGGPDGSGPPFFGARVPNQTDRSGANRSLPPPPRSLISCSPTPSLSHR